MNYKVKVTPSAAMDIKNLEHFYYKQSGLESAIRFEEAVETAIDIISENPRINRRFNDEFDESIRRIILNKRKVEIVYRIDDDKLEVIAVAALHTRSNEDAIISTIRERLG